MEVVDIKPRGYCKGVARSIALAKRARQEHSDQTITILGALVHNRTVSEALKLYNIHTLFNPQKSRSELLDEIDEGIVILSAHGSSKSVIKKAKDKGLTLIDATCEDVTKTHTLIEEALLNQYQIIYIGKENHPETNAIIENYPVHLVTQQKDIIELELDSQKIMVTNQTTLSLLEIQELFTEIIRIYPQAEIENEICMATTVRQKAIIETSDLDALVVVGDPYSNNTNMLAQIGVSSGIENVIRIESVQELSPSYFKEHWKVGITSGASTPGYLTNQVSDYLKNLDHNNPAPLPMVDLSKVLG